MLPRAILIAVVALSTPAGCRRSPPAASAPTQSSLPASTQSANQFRREPRHIQLATDEVRLPISFITGMPIITFQAADGTRHRLILDTGADSVVISPALVAACGLKTRTSDRSARDPSGSHEGLLAAHVTKLDLGSVLFEDFDADVEQIFAPGDALLGWPLYKALLVTIDYPHGVIIFTQGDLPPPDGQDILPLRLQQDRLEIQANLGGHDYWMALDTGWGNGSRVQLDAEQSKTLEWASPPVPMMLTNTAAGRVADNLGRLKGDLVLGRHQIVQPIAGSNEGHWVSIVGAMTLREFTVTLDLRHLRVAPGASIDRTDPLWPRPRRRLQLRSDEQSAESDRSPPRQPGRARRPASRRPAHHHQRPTRARRPAREHGRRIRHRASPRGADDFAEGADDRAGAVNSLCRLSRARRFVQLFDQRPDHRRRLRA